jgi:hypothetical protein
MHTWPTVSHCKSSSEYSVDKNYFPTFLLLFIIVISQQLKKNVGGLFGKKHANAPKLSKKSSSEDSFSDPFKHPPPAPTNVKVEFRDGLAASNEVKLSWQMVSEAAGRNAFTSQALLDLCRFEVSSSTMMTNRTTN